MQRARSDSAELCLRGFPGRSSPPLARSPGPWIGHRVYSGGYILGQWRIARCSCALGSLPCGNPWVHVDRAPLFSFILGMARFACSAP